MAIEDINWRELDYLKTVLCYILRGDEVLLIHKKTGLGKGKIVGPGGKLEEGETFQEACIREVQEEVGLTLREKDLDERGDLYFYEEGVYTIWNKVFVTNVWEGEPQETTEASPFWESGGNLPFSRMWKDDLYWMLPLLQGSYIQGCFQTKGDDIVSLYTELGSRPLKSLHLCLSLKDRLV